MKKMTILVVIWLAVRPSHALARGWRDKLCEQACMEACMRERPNADLQRQEVIVLEKGSGPGPFLLGDANILQAGVQR